MKVLINNTEIINLEAINAELLAALKGLVEARWMATIDWAPMEDYEVFMDKANEAIAKATNN